MRTLITCIILTISTVAMTQQSYSWVKYDKFDNEIEKGSEYALMEFKYDKTNNKIYVRVTKYGKITRDDTYRVIRTNFFYGWEYTCSGGLTIKTKDLGQFGAKLTFLYSDGTRIEYSGVEVKK